MTFLNSFEVMTVWSFGKIFMQVATIIQKIIVEYKKGILLLVELIWFQKRLSNVLWFSNILD